MAAIYDTDNPKSYKVLRTGLKPPSSNWSDIKCPFCGDVVRAYWWSLCGGGKRCTCGAKHNGFGQTHPLKAKDPK